MCPPPNADRLGANALLTHGSSGCCLDGVDRPKILCITNQKRRRHMANRVFNTLAAWTCADRYELDKNIP